MEHHGRGLAVGDGLDCRFRRILRAGGLWRLNRTDGREGFHQLRAQFLRDLCEARGQFGLRQLAGDSEVEFPDSLRFRDPDDFTAVPPNDAMRDIREVLTPHFGGARHRVRWRAEELKIEVTAEMIENQAIGQFDRHPPRWRS